MNEHQAILNPAATDHLPFFVTAPGQSDGLFTTMVVFLIVVVFAVGLLYLRLHALPEHLAHGTSKVQLQLVGVLTLLALFTHNHIFWIAALLLALVQFPNFSAPLASMARSLEKLADRAPPAGARANPGRGGDPWTGAVEPGRRAPQQAVPPKPVPAGKASIERTEPLQPFPESVLTHARVPALLLADHPPRLPVPQVCPGQADRPGDHAVLVVVRAPLGHHRLRAADHLADHADLLLSPCQQQRRFLLPHRTRPARNRWSRGGGFRRAARGSGGGHAPVQARQLRAAGRGRKRAAAHHRGRRGARGSEDRAPSRRG